MKKQLKFIPILVLVFSIITAGTIRFNDFSATWKLDASKSDSTGVSEGNALPTVMKLLKADTAVSFDRTFTSMPEPSKQVLKLDGTELVTKKGYNETRRSLSLSEDKLIMTVKVKTHVIKEGEEPWDYTRTETYTLAKDGNTLELTRVLVYPDKTETAKGVYNRSN